MPWLIDLAEPYTADPAESLDEDAASQKGTTTFGDRAFSNRGGAVGELPPESESPDQCFLQAQFRICLMPSVAPKLGSDRQQLLNFG